MTTSDISTLPSYLRSTHSNQQCLSSQSLGPGRARRLPQQEAEVLRTVGVGREDLCSVPEGVGKERERRVGKEREEGREGERGG